MPTPRDKEPGLQGKWAAALWRPALLAVGWAFLALGVAGLFLPIVPGTLFLIIAAACFTRSSPRFERWLLNHPRLGPPIRTWRATGAIPRRVKWFACLSLLGSWAVILTAGAPLLARIASFALFCGVGIYIVSRPEG